jgi:hypothetical protein
VHDQDIPRRIVYHRVGGRTAEQRQAVAFAGADDDEIDSGLETDQVKCLTLDY